MFDYAEEIMAICGITAVFSLGTAAAYFVTFYKVGWISSDSRFIHPYMGMSVRYLSLMDMVLYTQHYRML